MALIFTVTPANSRQGQRLSSLTSIKARIQDQRNSASSTQEPGDRMIPEATRPECGPADDPAGKWRNLSMNTQAAIVKC